MGMEIGARIKKGNLFDFASEDSFKGIDFIDGTDMRCSQTIRRALAYGGIDFHSIDGFIIISHEDAPKLVEKIQGFINRYNLSPIDKNVIGSLIQFMNKCIENKFYMTIG